MSPRHLLYSLIALPIALLVAFDFGCMPFVSTHTLRTIASTSTRSLRPVRPIRPLPFAALFGSSAAQTQIAKSNSGNHEMSGEQPKVQKSEGEWQAVLSPEQVSPARVTR
jgi:hypothetical protein